MTRDGKIVPCKVWGKIVSSFIWLIIHLSSKPILLLRLAVLCTDEYEAAYVHPAAFGQPNCQKTENLSIRKTQKDYGIMF